VNCERAGLARDPVRNREPAQRVWGSRVRGIRTGSSGRRGAGAFVNRQFLIAALIASATLAFAGVTQASTPASSPPAPLRAAVSPRHSAAGASATATHAVRSHHKRRHHRHRIADHAQLNARGPNTAAGGSPPQPARRSSVPNHHAALRPASHEFRNLLRSRTGGHGAAAESFARINVSNESSGLDPSSLPPAISHDDQVSQGRGPPRAGPVLDASLSPPYQIHSSNAFPTHHPLTFDLTRDRLMSLPHAVRLEGAAACSDCPP